MLELLEKTMMTAIGAAALSQKKADELLQELQKKFNVTEKEGKDFLTRLQETAKQNQAKLEELAQQEVLKACERIGVVSAEEFNKLKKKVAQIEKRLKEQGA